MSGALAALGGTGTLAPWRAGPARLRIGWAAIGEHLAAAVVLIWPALVNGYPLVFSDTGTYISQAIQHYLGWDRPAFYSLFLLALHGCVTTWPAILAQGVIATLVVWVTARLMGLYRARWWLIAALAVASPLPFFVSQLMPDLFTALMALAIAALVLRPEALARWERWGLAGLVCFAMAAHLSNPPIGVALMLALGVGRRRLGAVRPLTKGDRRRLIAAPALALAALMAANVAAHGRFSVAPYGNVFLLTRVIYDGPGKDVLLRDCPRPGWRLCRFAHRLPARADTFLWSDHGPIVRAGGAKRVSREANAIIAAAVLAEPWREAGAMLRNTWRQATLFQTGDGLHAWPRTVTPWIDRDFPAFEARAYAHSRQTEGKPVLPGWLARLHGITALGALLLCLGLLPGALRHRRLSGGLIVTMLLTLSLNAAITGALSGPHARYQSRVMWLPLLTALLATSEATRRTRA
jgi:hypothetical protein